MAGTEIAQRAPEQQLIARLRDETTREQLAMALPPAITIDRFIRVTTTALLTNPDIAKLEHTSVLRAIVQIAGMGLMPDGKQAAITPRKINGVQCGVAVPMIQGFRDIAATHGWTLRTAVVYSEDEFDHLVEDGEEKILHRPVRPGARRGELIASYAIAKHRDGRKIMTVLHPEDIAHRRKSSSYDKVWNEHPAAMWEKSAGRAIFKQIGLAENDVHVQQLLAEELDPGEATTALYGPSEISARSTEPPTTGTSTAEQGGERQQATDAPLDPGASVAPGDDEPDLDHPELNADEQAAIEAAANDAAMFELPSGKHAGKTLGELSAIDGSDGWFVFALRKTDLNPTVSQNVWAFARVFKPELFQQVLAEREAQAAA